MARSACLRAELGKGKGKGTSQGGIEEPTLRAADGAAKLAAAGQDLPRCVATATEKVAAARKTKGACGRRRGQLRSATAAPTAVSPALAAALVGMTLMFGAPSLAAAHSVPSDVLKIAWTLAISLAAKHEAALQDRLSRDRRAV